MQLPSVATASRPTAFDPLAYADEVEHLARQGGWKVAHLSPIGPFRRPWLHRQPVHPQRAWAEPFYISAGIHGDEPASPMAVLETLKNPGCLDRLEVYIFPLLNPVGLRRHTRENGDGIDLNRDYNEPRSEEIRGHIEVLKTLGRLSATMQLHEDYEGIGAYVFELTLDGQPACGELIAAAMERHLPLDVRSAIDELAAQGGIIRPDMELRKRPDWPEALYLGLHHCETSYTIETPKPFPLATRVAAQQAAIQALAEWVAKSTSGIST